MFIIEWMFDKMGYTKKVDWTSVFPNLEESCQKPKVATKKKVAAKKTTRKPKKV
jgi:hypothetical protein